jgi:hypothetical protein
MLSESNALRNGSTNGHILTPNGAVFFPPCLSDYALAPAPKPKRAGWRNHEPLLVHSIK